ncbi:MAG: sigma-70 family RNA polymerase sigma factor [Pirellulaceae bacterium]|nr:sigma-70 family RNA polymerase sigma factor [Pirellulaceae bacterium]
MPSDDSWEATLNHVLPQALALAVRVCGSLPAAEDAVQEGLVKIIQSRESFRGQAQLSTWMLQIVLNACRDWLRKNRPSSEREIPRQTNASQDSSEGQGSTSSNGQVVVGGLDLDHLANPRSDDPSSVPIQAEERLRIRHAVEQLPARQREVVQLLIWQGLSATEVAGLTATTAQNVYANFHAAKQQLRVLLVESSPTHRPQSQ